MLPLILQPLVENAIRHGIEPLPQGGEVRTEVRREGDDVLVRVVDDGVAAEPEPTARASVGLRGVRVRLEHLYGTRARCEVSTAPGRGYAVMLCLPIPVA